HRGHAGLDRGVGDLAAARVQDDLVGVAGLRGEVALQHVERALRLAAGQGEVGGVAGADRARHDPGSDEQGDPGDEDDAPVRYRPASESRQGAFSTRRGCQSVHLRSPFGAVYTQLTNYGVSKGLKVKGYATGTPDVNRSVEDDLQELVQLFAH